jgi:FKBP-type peptidyl-prolyl cis-trans isomerase FkpA/FKBP-type peptidyl-prolyl cis-trans isomerase FklB
MKTIKVLSLLAVSAILLASCGEKKQPAAKDGNAAFPTITKAEIDSVSYAVGVTLGHMIKEANFGDIDMGKVQKAMNDVLKGKEKLMVDQLKAGPIIQGYLRKRSEIVAAENLEKGNKFLETNKTKDSVKVTASGLQYIIRTEGETYKPSDVDTVEVMYKGTLIDGTEFDTNYGQNPAKFAVGNVISGWKEGIKLVGKGGKVKLFIPAALAYGPQQASAKITPNSVLIFDVEIKNVIPGKIPAPQPEATQQPAAPKKK